MGVVGWFVVEKGFFEFFVVVREFDDWFMFVVIGFYELDKVDLIDVGIMVVVGAVGVVFLGMCDDVDVLYRVMDMFVFFLYCEGFLWVVMEVVVLGFFLIVFDICGCCEVVEDGVNGFFVLVCDLEVLCVVIVKFGDDDELWYWMVKVGRIKVVVEFDECCIVD